MKIAALYLSDHAYLSHEFDLINFGGKYIYSIKETGDSFTVSRNPNPQYIEGFFNISASKIVLENVGAIVGQNGVGKSTLLDVIRRNFIENTYALPRVRSFLLIEYKDSLCFYSKDEIELQLREDSTITRLEKIAKEKVQTIYYSPHFDLRYNPNFDEVDYFDISLDKYIDLDLEDLNARGTNEHGVDYPVKQELLFKNSMRQIFFLNSSLVIKGIFKEQFDFPEHGNATLTIRETKYEKSMRNVPLAFLSGLDQLQKKIETELDDWAKVRLFDKKQKVTNQLDIDRYLLKRNLLHDLLSILIRQMDISNSYLSEAEFDQDAFDAAENANAFEYFLAFLNACKINTAKGAVSPFDTDLIAQLITKIYQAADTISNAEFLKQHQLMVPPEDAIAILELHKEMVFDVSGYYNKQLRERPKDYNRFNYFVPGFIFYAPAARKLSSGENALLNLFSRLYDFLENKVNPVLNGKEEIETFILLMDEADSGFHPVWKKKFVNALVQTLPYFFEQYKQKPSLQIIFTTHDPLTLSDLPSANVVCLVTVDGKVKALDQAKRLPTFGANITDLLADSFFIDDGLIGDFARNKITEVIKWLESDSKDDAPNHRRFIGMIDEPIVRRKLAEMYDDKMQEEFELSMIDQQIAELQQLRKIKAKK